MATGNEAEMALKGIEERLSNGRATDVMSSSEEILRVQQDFLRRLDQLKAEM